LGDCASWLRRLNIAKSVQKGTDPMLFYGVAEVAAFFVGSSSVMMIRRIRVG